MNAIELLETQHDEVKALFKKCEKASGEAKRQLFEKIADDLAVHAARAASTASTRERECARRRVSLKRYGIPGTPVHGCAPVVANAKKPPVTDPSAVGFAGGPAGIAVNRGSPVALRHRLSTALL